MRTTDAIFLSEEESNPKLNIRNNSITCVDLFCGIGGLTHGFIRKGINVVGGVDLDPKCRFPYETNNNSVFIEEDISEITGRDITALFRGAGVRLLAGCAPCQPFSKYSQSVRPKSNDMKWSLVSEFGRLVIETEPDLVTMENVPQLKDHTVFREFLESLIGYSIWWDIINCSDYGIPQTRKRLVLLASKLGAIKMEPPQNPGKYDNTVKKAIAHLPYLTSGQSDPGDRLHTACSLSELNMRRIKASKPGGTWQDWDEELIARCHRKNSGQTYPSVYGRMEWDKPSPTITTQCFGYGNGRFGHPDQDRAISLREAAILQTFPATYAFVPNSEQVRFNILGRLIGNAVPVRLGEAIAESIIKHVATHFNCTTTTSNTYTGIP